MTAGRLLGSVVVLALPVVVALCRIMVSTAGSDELRQAEAFRDLWLIVAGAWLAYAVPARLQHSATLERVTTAVAAFKIEVTRFRDVALDPSPEWIARYEALRNGWAPLFATLLTANVGDLSTLARDVRNWIDFAAGHEAAAALIRESAAARRQWGDALEDRVARVLNRLDRLR